MNKKTQLIGIAMLAGFLLLGAALMLFVPVGAGGDRKFVPAVMIGIALAVLLIQIFARSAKCKEDESGGSARALRVGTSAFYVVLIALSMIVSRSNIEFAKALVIAGALSVLCNSAARLFLDRMAK